MSLVRKCEGIIAEVDYNLGILPVMLHRWIYEYSTNPEYAFPGLGKLKEPDEEVRIPTMNFVFISRNIK